MIETSSFSHRKLYMFEMTAQTPAMFIFAISFLNLQKHTWFWKSAVKSHKTKGLCINDGTSYTLCVIFMLISFSVQINIQYCVFLRSRHQFLFSKLITFNLHIMREIASNRLHLIAHASYTMTANEIMLCWFYCHHNRPSIIGYSPNIRPQTGGFHFL